MKTNLLILIPAKRIAIVFSNRAAKGIKNGRRSQHLMLAATTTASCKRTIV